MGKIGLYNFKNISVHVYYETDHIIWVNGTELCQILSNHEKLKKMKPFFGSKWIYQSKTLDEFIMDNHSIRETIHGTVDFDLSSKFTVKDLLKHGYFKIHGKGTENEGIYIPEYVAGAIIIESTFLSRYQKVMAIITCLKEVEERAKEYEKENRKNK